MGLVRSTVLRYWWLWIVLLAFLTYLSVIDNFFGWDDFLWLYRAKTLSSNPFQVFNVDTLYFDPLVHLLFWLNFKLFGLDYRWYHVMDIAIHAVNGLLVFQFVKLYSDNRSTALLSALIFVTAFGASDAVLWSSSRVDVFAALFSLITITLFLKYLKEHKTAFYISSIAAYVLALGAKGTPVTVPILLFWLFIKERQVSKKQYSIFIPFAVIAFVYLFLLRMAIGPGSPLFKGFFHPNIYNYSLSLSSLFIPEPVLSKLSLTYTFPLVYGLLFIIWLIKFSPQIDRVKSTGLFMMFLFLTPILILYGDFKLSSTDFTAYHVLGSPSHRIYLATIGMSIFLGSAIISLNKRPIIISAALLLIGFNIYEVSQRENIWEGGTSEIKDSGYRLKSLKQSFPEQSIIVFVNFPLPEGFFEPYMKVYHDLNEVTTLSLKKIDPKLPDPQQFDIPADRSYFGFIRGKKGIYDISDSIKVLMATALNYQKATDELIKENYRKEYEQLAVELNTIIPRIEMQ